MPSKFFSKGIKLNIHSPGTGAALLLLALTHVPVAVKDLAEIACIAEISNKTWRTTNSHKGVNVKAVSICNGGK